VSRKKREKTGRCRICGTQGSLSWEHVPPASAFNKKVARRASQEQLMRPGPWDGSGEILQRGVGAYTLCASCNNNTGAWYGSEYADWAGQAADQLRGVAPEGQTVQEFIFRGRPLRFLKQVVTMFFSVNAEGFADAHPELVKFVLDREKQGLPAGYRFQMALVRGTFSRSSGVSVRGNLLDGTVTAMSEVAHAPFAHSLVLQGKADERAVSIESLAQCGFDDEAEVTLKTLAGHVHTKYPADYRSSAEVARDANRKP
jgi:hypothetical protein